MRIVDLYGLKPIDRAALLASARATGGTLLTVEDHHAEGGLGAAVGDRDGRVGRTEQVEGTGRTLESGS